MKVHAETIETGDKITFVCHIAMRRFKTTVIVRNIREDDSALYVNLKGCKNFVVYPDEIVKLYKKVNQDQASKAIG